MNFPTAGSELGSVADLPIERLQFRPLLLAGHFDHLPHPAEGTPPAGDTAYEQLTCVGYQPQLKQLNAVVQIKRPNGYLGSICTAGSTEYVRFYSSTDDGATWNDLGLTSFTAYDTPGTKPLVFDVTLPVDLSATCCRFTNIVQVRAVLSWQVAPTSPTSPVVWGNGLDAHIQVAPARFGTLEELAGCLESPIDVAALGEVVDPGQVIAFGTSTPLSAGQLHKLYAAGDVPQHRYLLSAVSELIADPIALGTAAAHPGTTLFPTLEDEVDIASLLKFVLDPQGDETYEQLGCLGYNPSANTLVATVDIKLSSGYSGGLCTTGSNEYVAFWADWGAGTWEYAGTAAVNVHDISPLPGGGLQYAAALPFADALTHQQPCTDGPLEVPIRAVLSWGTPPSSTNPYQVPVWGGHLEGTVLIAPGEPVSEQGGADLESIGSMPIDLIDASGLASGQSLVGFVADHAPFGGSITFTGHVVNPSGGLGGSGLQYRILVSANNGATSAPMLGTFDVETDAWATDTQTTVMQTPDTDGWYTCLENYAAGIDVVGNVLGFYDTAGNGQLWISMQAREGTTLLGQTPWKLIQLDNTAPSPVQVTITSGGGSCGDFAPGDPISGTYYAADNEDLASVSISVEGPIPGSTMSQTITSQTLTSESGGFTLTTLTSTEPCGYTIVATAVDNTIVDSGTIGWPAYGYTGFCLRPANS